MSTAKAKQKSELLFQPAFVKVNMSKAEYTKVARANTKNNESWRVVKKLRLPLRDQYVECRTRLLIIIVF